MKNFPEKHPSGMLISFLSAVLVIIGLCGWIYLDFVGDGRRDEWYRTEADSAAYRLLDSLEAGDAILSYHYARQVHDNAAGAGEQDAAHTFAGLSETIRITGITEDMRTTVAEYLRHGGDEQEETETAFDLPVEADEPDEVAAIRRNDALAAAEEIMGTSGILTMAVACRDGEFLFSCRNAYAVIDEKTSLPVEVGISLPAGNSGNRLTPEECREAADRFLMRYFPSAQAEAVRVYPEGDAVAVEYFIDGRAVTASVRRDTGKIVRYVAR